jgi:hypothetical protein
VGGHYTSTWPLAVDVFHTIANAAGKEALNTPRSRLLRRGYPPIAMEPTSRRLPVLRSGDGYSVHAVPMNPTNSNWQRRLAFRSFPIRMAKPLTSSHESRNRKTSSPPLQRNEILAALGALQPMNLAPGLRSAGSHTRTPCKSCLTRHEPFRD